MSSALKNLTWADIRDLPEDAGRTEIIDGELYFAPVPSERHQRIATALGAAIYPHVRRLGLGKFYSSAVHVILAPHVNFEPDLCFFAVPEDLDIVAVRDSDAFTGEGLGRKRRWG